MRGEMFRFSSGLRPAADVSSGNTTATAGPRAATEENNPLRRSRLRTENVPYPTIRFDRQKPPAWFVRWLKRIEAGSQDLLRPAAVQRRRWEAGAPATLTVASPAFPASSS